MKIERFEDVKAWQMACELTNLVYKVAASGAFARDFRLKDQIRDAAGSVMHNIAEGFDAGSDAEFIRFLRYSRRSASEVQSQLYVALDQTTSTPTSFDSSMTKPLKPRCWSMASSAICAAATLNHSTT